MISTIISRLVILVFGTLYPAYASYKAIKTKNIREYVKWMMYWIVFAIFTAVETFADVFISWIPFYYELKIVFVFWLLSPATRGSSILYRNFVHPRLVRYEPEIDRYITTATEKGYSGLVEVSAKGLDLVKHAVITAAVKGQSTLLTQLSNADRSRSVSMNDMRGVGAGGDHLDGFEPFNQDLVNGNAAQQQDARRVTRRQRQVDVHRSSSNAQLPSSVDNNYSDHSPIPHSTHSKKPHHPEMSSMLFPTAVMLASNLGLGPKMREMNVERVAYWLANKSVKKAKSKNSSSYVFPEVDEEVDEDVESPQPHDSTFYDDQEQDPEQDSTTEQET